MFKSGLRSNLHLWTFHSEFRAKYFVTIQLFLFSQTSNIWIVLMSSLGLYPVCLQIIIHSRQKFYPWNFVKCQLTVFSLSCYVRLFAVSSDKKSVSAIIAVAQDWKHELYQVLQRKYILFSLSLNFRFYDQKKEFHIHFPTCQGEE